MSASLDHLIFHVEDLESAQTQWREYGLTVIEGGTHADGASANALIVLADGVYIELFAFLKSTPEHWWHSKPTGGWIDFALTPDGKGSEAFVSEINGRANSTTKYRQPQKGGRLTKDESKQIEWLVTFVDAPQAERGRLPFLCEDITERTWRVPSEHSKHPNGCTSIASLTLLAAPSQLSRYLESLDPIFGRPNELPPSVQTGPQNYPPRSRTFSIQSPLGKEQIEIEVHEAQGMQEMQWVRTHGEGLFSAKLHGDTSKTFNTGLYSTSA